MSETLAALCHKAFVDALRTARSKHGVAMDAEIAAELPAAFARYGVTLTLTLPGEEGPAQPGAAARHGFHALLASPDHILVGMTCWCRPYRDPEDPEVIIHRAEGKA